MREKVQTGLEVLIQRWLEAEEEEAVHDDNMGHVTRPLVRDLPFAIVGVPLVAQRVPVVPVDHSRVDARVHRVRTLVDALIVLVQVRVGRVV